MSSFKLHNYQIQAASRLAYMCEQHRYRITYDEENYLPIILTLSSVTGSGKTPMLAQTVADINKYYKTNLPIFMWISYDKIIVDQTTRNLTEGKYRELLGGNPIIKPFVEINSDDIEDEDNFLIYLDTVQKFNSNTRENRIIFQVDEDLANVSKWDLLKTRRERDLIVIYDEVHKLSEAQSNKIMELKPMAIVTGSGTPKHSKTIKTYIKKLESSIGLKDEKELTVKIPLREVKKEQLVAKYIRLHCYEKGSDEYILNTILESHNKKKAIFEKLGGDEHPKVAYVCTTNIITGLRKDSKEQVFRNRQAPAIKIWLYLVCEKNIDPDKIAIHLDIEESKNPAYKFDEDFKKNLFNTSTSNTFDQFLERDYTHIIFNKSLATGWDDPYIYDVYIDKTMNSDTDVKQIIGRVIRQPNSKYYRNQQLNEPTIHIKIDNKQVYEKIIREINTELSDEYGEIIPIKNENNDSDKEAIDPKAVYKLPRLARDVKQIKDVLDKIIDDLPDYRTYSKEKRGGNGIIRTYKYAMGEAYKEEDEKEISKSNTVLASMVLERCVIQRSVTVWNSLTSSISPTKEKPNKFNVQIGWNSHIAKELEECASKLIEVYRENIELVPKGEKDRDGDAHYEVGPVNVSKKPYEEDQEKGYQSYKNSLHARYSGLNGLERSCASLIDSLGLPWCRNPHISGYGITLLDIDSIKKMFYPDFIIWSLDKKTATLLEVTGKHLRAEKLKYKLLAISSEGERYDYSDPDLAHDLSISIIVDNSDPYNKTQGEYELFSLRKGKIAGNDAEKPLKSSYNLLELIKAAITKL